MTDPRCTLEACKNAGIRSFAAVSMRTEEKQIGVLALGNHEPRNFQENDRFLSSIADSLAISTEKSRLYERLKEYAATLEE